MCHDLEAFFLCLYPNEFVKCVTEQLNAKSSLASDSLQHIEKSYTEAILLVLQEVHQNIT